MVNSDPLIPFFDSISSETDSNKVKIDDEREDPLGATPLRASGKSYPSSLRPQPEPNRVNSDPLIPIFYSKSCETNSNRVNIDDEWESPGLRSFFFPRSYFYDRNTEGKREDFDRERSVDGASVIKRSILTLL